MERRTPHRRLTYFKTGIYSVYMNTTIQKWGNSFAVRLPKAITKQLRMGAGTKVRIDADKRRIIIQQVPKKKETLEDLVARITPETRHKKIDWGGPVGKEIW